MKKRITRDIIFGALIKPCGWRRTIPFGAAGGDMSSSITGLRQEMYEEIGFLVPSAGPRENGPCTDDTFFHRRRIEKMKESQHGIALLIVLWVMTILIVTVLSFTLLTRADTQGTLAFKDQME